MNTLTGLGTITEMTNATYTQGKFVDNSKVFVTSLNMWVCLTSDNDPAQPPKQCPVG